MTKKILWRLKESPTTENLRELVKDKILTADEAREILFSSVEESERDIESLKSEIKFLREIVQSLSQNRSQIVTTIEKIVPIYKQFPWYRQYDIWCANDNMMYCTADSNTASTASLMNSINSITTSSADFTNIKTF